MVRLLEFEVKNILKQAGLALPKQFELADLANTNIYPIVIKSQVPIGGRGKLGGIRFANDSNEANSLITQLNSLKIGGYLPKSLLLEEKLSIYKEYYCGFIVNRDLKSINFIFSDSGGIDVEKVSEQAAEKINVQEFRLFPDNLDDLSDNLVENLGLEKVVKSKLKPLISSLLEIIRSYDAELFEINPLIETTNHELVIADARMNIDDNALFRHIEYQKNLEYYFTPLELRARALKMAYVELDGSIGVICNGAGLVMGTIDAVQSYGMKAANFLDVGGGADAERMYQALKIISSNEKVQGVLINIIGGITRCDEIAKGLIKFLKEGKVIKFALRLIGTNEQEGQDLLKPYNIAIHSDLDDTIQSITNLIRSF